MNLLCQIRTRPFVVAGAMLLGVGGLMPQPEARAQALASASPERKVEIPFNRYYTGAELEAWMAKIAEAHPDLVELRSLGESRNGRPLTLAIVTAPGELDHSEKPAIWIDGSIHGNELQASEVVLYTMWYLTEAHGRIPAITTLLEDYTFYLMPLVNPDGRAYWFEEPATPHTGRQSIRPRDLDRDGLVDEDPLDDLDGDGSITQMWRPDPNGQWERDKHDPRRFYRVEEGQRGSWSFLGQEGLDRDADGRANEDGPFGDDMNRAWPAGWKPDYVQRGAGLYPLEAPETRVVAEFMIAHPNITTAQAYHNTGGMILRGPGAPHRGEFYPREDLRVYDEMGRIGEQILPHYNYWIIHEDLYIVHGGFVNWAAEGLGAFAFTNELMTFRHYFWSETRPDERAMWLFRDRLEFGLSFKEHEWFDHPQHGRVLIGGLNKWSSRLTPTFMLEEEAHRNAAFTFYHADQMPKVDFDRVATRSLGGGLWEVTAELRNEKLIPTRSALQQNRGIGMPDLVECEPARGRVLVGGVLRHWQDRQLEREQPREPGRLRLDEGVPSRGVRTVRFLVEGREGEQLTLRFTSERAVDRTRSLRLGDGE